MSRPRAILYSAMAIAEQREVPIAALLTGDGCRHGRASSHQVGVSSGEAGRHRSPDELINISSNLACHVIPSFEGCSLLGQADDERDLLRSHFIMT